jgi:hypothetical protein
LKKLPPSHLSLQDGGADHEGLREQAAAGLNPVPGIFIPIYVPVPKKPIPVRNKWCLEVVSLNFTSLAVIVSIPFFPIMQMLIFLGT